MGTHKPSARVQCQRAIAQLELPGPVRQTNALGSEANPLLVAHESETGELRPRSFVTGLDPPNRDRLTERSCSRPVLLTDLTAAGQAAPARPLLAQLTCATGQLDLAPVDLHGVDVQADGQIDPYLVEMHLRHAERVGAHFHIPKADGKPARANGAHAHIHVPSLGLRRNSRAHHRSKREGRRGHRHQQPSEDHQPSSAKRDAHRPPQA